MRDRVASTATVGATDGQGPQAVAGDEAEQAHFLVFRVGGEICAFALTLVQEIVRVPRIVGVPLSPPSVRGLVNLRGRVLPVISARGALDVPEEETPGEHSRIVVLQNAGGYGLLVDRVDGVATGEPAPLKTAQDVPGRDVFAGTLHAEGKVMLLLDAERLVRRELVALPVVDTLAEAAGLAALPGEVADGGVEDDVDGWRFVAFCVSGQEYGLPVESVREIGRVPEALSRVPHTASHLLGIAPLRGRLLPFVDLHALLGLPPAAESKQARVLVLSVGDGASVGLVVDTVNEVMHVEHAPEALPPLWERPEDAELQGMLCLDGGRRVVVMLAAERVLQSVLSELTTEGDAMSDEQPVDGFEVGEDAEMLVVFLLADQEFALPVDAVREILRVPEQLARVPGAADFVEGMVNLRGTVLPVLDHRRRLGLPGGGRGHRQRIVVVEGAGGSTGFTVDAVRDVLAVPKSSLGPAPALSEAQARVVRQVANLVEEGRMILVVDPEELVRGAEVPVSGARS